MPWRFPTGDSGCFSQMGRLSALGLAAALALAPAGASAALPAEEPPAWSFSGSVYNYVIPGDEDFLMPIAYVDRGRLRLEARYNYEERAATSLWAGWRFAFGDEVSLELIPMLGGVFGAIEGVAPGLELSLGWKSLSYYMESEYLFDLTDEEGSFFYAWSELAWEPLEWLRVGAVGQRTRVVDTDLEIQRGLMAGVSWRRVQLTSYFFNPGGDDEFTVFSLSFSP